MVAPGGTGHLQQKLATAGTSLEATHWHLGVVSISPRGYAWEMEPAEQKLVKLIEWLLAVTEHGISPDAYATMLKVTQSGVLHVFRRSARPHQAEIVDLGTAVGIICPRRRPEARYGLFFLREALVFEEEEYAQPILASSPQPTIKTLVDTLYDAAQSYSSRYMPPEHGSFTSYQAYYSNLTYRELLADAQGLPAIVALNRSIALFERLIDLSCEDQAVSPDDRYRAAILSGSIEDQVRTTQSTDVVQRFDLAAQTTFDNLMMYARYPDMAERIRVGEFSKVRTG
jgi:hypothetical protein